ncbi:MAG: YbaK/EbsC family protein, partial [Pseudomonadota bacterium]
TRADPTRIREETGFAIGGVSPIGHLSHPITWLDTRLLDFDQVWAAAGTPRHVFSIDPNGLATLTKAKPL